jgi:hypothetical protein
MRAIATSCAPGTANRRRLAWRRIGLVITNCALWGGVWGLFKCL